MIITLTTDFGLSDPFVGIMKGVILGIAPGAQIVDVSHEIRSYDIVEGAFLIDSTYRYFPQGTVHVVRGGATRQQSVYEGLNAVMHVCEGVLVHDGARPLVTGVDVRAGMREVRAGRAALLATPVVDTIKNVDPATLRVTATLDRATLWAAQTPQFALATDLRAAHDRARREGVDATDDAALLERIGIEVVVVPSSNENFKVTLPSDVERASRVIHGMTRIGHGFDAHRLVEGRAFVLGGVRVPFERGALGHSDGDVLAHALADALLGAAALGDLGGRFPDSDPRWKDADSMQLLAQCADAVREAGFAIGNVDATIVVERPKLAPFIDEMRENVATRLRIEVGAVGLKAKTSEGMGYTGDGSGIGAYAVALLTQLT